MDDTQQMTAKEKFKVYFPNIYEEIVRVIYNEDNQDEEVISERIFEIICAHMMVVK